MIKNFLKRKIIALLNKFINKFKQNNFKIKLLITLFLLTIIFSVLGDIKKNSNEDSQFYISVTAVCFTIWWALLPISENKKDKIFKKSLIYFIMSIATLYAIPFWLDAYFISTPSNWKLIFATILLFLIIFFLIDVLETLFKVVISALSKFWDKVLNPNLSPISTIIKSITAILVTITTFIISLIGLIKLFMPN